ncbi:MAG: aspartate--tRNA ligase [Rhodospirillales bacterium]|nr:aspartate--tRNA ligase [Rhodospirillales bacterium]
MHRYRTHTCGDLCRDHVGEIVRLSGWVHRKRDHGNLLFVDLRDHYGMTQCVIETDGEHFPVVEAVRSESVVTIEGPVVARTDETVNPDLPTGHVEVRIRAFDVLSAAEILPMPVFGEVDYPEDMRLRYRFLDLRREQMQKNIVLRSKVIHSIRMRMVEAGFTEFQTPILTASSPEGARDFLVPSRLHPGEFYALPQAPQQFKQLVMASGFDRYFQIAPCFRDEDARADRSPGEFYQLDVEMNFVTQEDVLSTIEPVMHGVFEEFADRPVTPMPFPRIGFDEAMLKYGTDKPDLRNPVINADVTATFAESDFKIFRSQIEKGAVACAIPAPGAGGRPRSFFDKMIGFAQDNGAKGLAYIIFEDGAGKGPIAKLMKDTELQQIRELAGVGDGDAVFFSCAAKGEAERIAGLVRTRVGTELGLLEENVYRFCWIVDYPMYEYDEKEKRIDFSHNPFSMPQGGLEALESRDPLEILAYQYDIVCNGVELCSGAIRNHEPDTMVKAFEIAGYTAKDVEERFGALFNAFQYGTPPHGGLAPGIDRIVMLLADEHNIRQITLFPMNQQAQDLMMGAPGEAATHHLHELHLRMSAEAEQRLKDKAAGEG